MLIIGVSTIGLVLSIVIMKYVSIKKCKRESALLLSLSKQESEARLKTGLDKLSEGNRKIKAIDKAISKDPHNGRLYFEKYRVLMDLEINDFWIKPLNKAIELGDEEALKERVVLQIAGAFMLIEKHLAGKEYFKALDLIDKEIRIQAADQNNTDPRAVELAVKLNKQRAAVVQLIEENRKMDGDSWKRLSDAYLRSKEYAKALHAIETAIQTDPLNGQFYYKKFIVLQMMDNGAREEWIEALKKAAAAEVELAEMLIEEINFEGFNKALHAIDAAIKADPGNGNLYFLVANILYALDVNPKTVWLAALLKAAELGSEKAVEMKNAIVNLFGAEQTTAAVPGNGCRR